MADVVLDHVDKVYENGYKAVSDLTLVIADGELLVLVGPSGCGKSTALRMVAGLESITSGELRIGGRRVNELSPRQRDIAMVFQSYALYPHMTVAENIGFGLKLRRMPPAEIDARVGRAARLLGLEDLLGRHPTQLSGGQRQRVAMGRAIVRQPQTFLMDEPLSNLDAKLRVHMRAEIARLQQEMAVTTIYVTHDQVEAMTLGHRVAVLNGGILQQVAAPQELYDVPVNLFVGAFIGSPPMNLVEAGVHADGKAMSLDIGGQVLNLDPVLVAERPALRNYVGDRVAMGVRAEDLHDASQLRDWPPDRRLRTTVSLTEALGSEVMVHFAVDGSRVVVGAAREEEGGHAGLFGLGAAQTPFVARFPPGTRARIGDTIDVAVDTSRVQCFDLDSGFAIRA